MRTGYQRQLDEPEKVKNVTNLLDFDALGLAIKVPSTVPLLGGGEFSLGIPKPYNKTKTEDAKQPQCPPEKESAIMDAMKHFGIIE